MKDLSPTNTFNWWKTDRDGILVHPQEGWSYKKIQRRFPYFAALGMMCPLDTFSVTKPQHTENSSGQRLCSSGCKCKKTWSLCTPSVNLEKTPSLLSRKLDVFFLFKIFWSFPYWCLCGQWSQQGRWRWAFLKWKSSRVVLCGPQPILHLQEKGKHRGRGSVPSAFPVSPGRNNINTHTSRQLASQALTTCKMGTQTTLKQRGLLKRHHLGSQLCFPPFILFAF